jgi:hypothetical protein
MEQNKTGKYLKYAIGEIVLVVIGILIALSINNWNESRKEIKLRANYLNVLKTDIESDIDSLEYYDEQNKIYENLGKYFLNFLEGDLVEIDSQTIYKALVYANFNPSYSLISSTYNDLISSGNLVLFKDLDFKNLLDKYYKRDDWHEKFDERIVKTMWYDYWDEKLKYVDGDLVKDFRISEIEETPIDYKKYNIDFAGLKSSNSFRQQLKTILYQRYVIKKTFSARMSSAKELLDYCEKNMIE